MAPLGAFAAAAGDEAATVWSGIPEAQVRLIAAQQAVPGAVARLGLEFRLAPSWKTYWRDPGESGVPPRFDWAASDNVSGVDVLWPAPGRFSAFGFDSFGYAGTVVLPLEVRLDRPGAPATVGLALNFLICAQVCVPVEAELALPLAAGPAEPTAHALAIARAAAQVPRRGPAAPFRVLSARAEGAPGAQVLEVVAEADRPFDAPDLMVEGPAPFGFGRPEVSLSDDGLQARLRLPVYAGPAKPALASGTLRFTLVDGGRAAESVLDLSTRG